MQRNNSEGAGWSVGVLEGKKVINKGTKPSS